MMSLSSNPTPTAAALECYRRAAEAYRIAEAASDAITKAEFIEIERHWRRLARSFTEVRKDDALEAPPVMKCQVA
jgi:hypothetical protein